VCATDDPEPFSRLYLHGQKKPGSGLDTVVVPWPSIPSRASLIHISKEFFFFVTVAAATEPGVIVGKCGETAVYDCQFGSSQGESSIETGPGKRKTFPRSVRATAHGV